MRNQIGPINGTSIVSIQCHFLLISLNLLTANEYVAGIDPKIKTSIKIKPKSPVRANRKETSTNIFCATQAYQKSSLVDFPLKSKEFAQNFLYFSMIINFKVFQQIYLTTFTKFCLFYIKEIQHLSFFWAEKTALILFEIA